MASILLVDDDDLIRDLLRHALTKAGHAVRQAGDGKEGLRLYLESPADLVITDLIMPEQEGLGFIMELRKVAPDARVIAISGGIAQNKELYLQMAAKLGAAAVLAKPFALAELLQAIAHLLVPVDAAGAPSPSPRG